MFVVECSSCKAKNRVSVSKLNSSPTCGGCGKALNLAKPHYVDDDGLDALIKDSPLPVLVDFYADWCGPCRRLGPVLEQVAAEQAGSVVVVKVDVDQYKRKAAEVGVQGIPAVHVFSGGQHRGDQVGLAPKAAYEALIRRAS